MTLRTSSLPAETRLGAIELRVADLEHSLEFYRDLLGIGVIEKEGGRAALAADPGGEPLLTLIEERGVRSRPSRSIGLYHLALRLPERRDLAQLLHRLLQKRWRPESASDNSVSEAVYLTDPDGNRVELYVDRPRDLWRWEDGGIVMRTTPLDLPGLLLDFRDELEAWQGLPPGTTLGHIHLHVADLRGAESFYSGLLGFEVTSRAYPGALFFSAGGYHHHIGVNTWTTSSARPTPGTAGLVSFEVVIPDRERLEEIRFDAVKMGFPVSAADGGWILEDQDGNLVVLREVTEADN